MTSYRSGDYTNSKQYISQKFFHIITQFVPSPEHNGFRLYQRTYEPRTVSLLRHPDCRTMHLLPQTQHFSTVLEIVPVLRDDAIESRRTWEMGTHGPSSWMLSQTSAV